MDTSLTLRERRNIATGISDVYLRGLHERGTEYFRERNYKAALQFFDKVWFFPFFRKVSTGSSDALQAIKQDAEAPLLIIDKRAATYLKLRDPDRALSDARKMIRQDQSNAIVRLQKFLTCMLYLCGQGYLRLGQILQLQSRPLKALKTYESGIRRISPEDAHFKVS